MQKRMVAVGDSIINGKTKTVAGVPGKSWARWAAEAAGYQYEQYARGGATSTEIVRQMLPSVTGRYDVGVLNMGTNDAILGFDPDTLRRNLLTAVETMQEHCDRVFMLSVPYSARADAIVQEVAATHGLTVIDGTLGGPRLFQPDRVHPTALGQLTLGDRFAAVLETPAPSLTAPGRGEGRLGVRYWVRYGYRWIKFRAKDIVRGSRLSASRSAPA